MILRPQYNVESSILPRKRRAPRHIKVGDGHHANNIEYHYRVLYFEAIDLAITGIKDKFDQPEYATYSNLESLLKAANHMIIQLNWIKLFLFMEMIRTKIC